MPQKAKVNGVQFFPRELFTKISLSWVYCSVQSNPSNTARKAEGLIRYNMLALVQNTQSLT